MSSFNRRQILFGPAACLFAVAACGFTPVYGPKGSAEALRNTIQLQEPDDPESYYFVKHFEERMGIANTPKYNLTYEIDTETDGIAINPSQETTRYNVIGEARYVLKEIGTGRKLASGTVQSFTSFGSTGFTISTRTSRDSAFQRLMIILADDIIDQLLANPKVTAP